MIKILNLILSVIFVVLIIPVSFSQVTLEWVKYNSGPSGSSTFYQIIKTDPAGNSYISGSYIYGNQFKGFSLKYSTSGAAGTTYWTSNQMQPTCFWIDNNFNVYSGGYFNQSPIRYLDVYKCSPQGIIWEVKDSLYGYGGNEASDITSDDEGNTYLLRFEGVYSIYKYSPNGSCTKHPLSGIPEAAKITIDKKNNDIILVYYKYDFGKAGHIARYDSNFNLKWDNFLTVLGDVIKLICVPSRNIYTLDDKWGVTRLDSSGITKATMRLADCSDFAVDSIENVTITGSSGTYRMPKSGIPWHSTIPGKAICLGEKDCFYIVNSSNNNINVLKIRQTFLGEVLWTYEFNSNGNNIDSALGISIDSSFNLYVSGKVHEGSTFKSVVYKLSQILGVSKDPLKIPVQCSLFQNYPNPFNPSTKISFDIPASSDVKITVYDFLGREIETIVQQHFSAGSYDVNWNASDYSSGVYFYKLTAGDYTESKKMILLK